MATLVTVTLNDKRDSWLCRPSGNDCSVLAMRGVLQENHFLGDEVDVEKFVAMVKEELADTDITVRVFKEQ